jgi:pimeloyl-ACP methyl ester carboxylesterase
MPLMRLDDIEVNYEVSGKGPPILFLAGMGLDLSIWSKVKVLLERRFACVMMDARGAGGTDAPRAEYTVRQMADDAAALLGKLGCGPAVVAGHSMGGFTALQMALDHPSAVAGLALIGTAAAGGPEELGSTAAAREALSRTWGPPTAMIRQSMTVSVSRLYRETRVEDFERLVFSRCSNRAKGRGLAGQRAACGAFDVGERIRQISCPALILHGIDDQIVAVSRGERLARDIPGARMVCLAGVGHLPQWEVPMDVAREIKASFGRGSVL